MLTSRPILVCVTPFVPYEGIAHAGGLYVLNHLRELSRHFEIFVIAPHSRENMVEEVLPGFIQRLILIHPPRLPALIRNVLKMMMGTSFEPGWVNIVLRNEDVRALARSAAVIDLQWSQSAVLGRKLRRMNRSARQTLTVHDVLTQRWLRSFKESGRSTEKAYYLIRTLVDRFNEWRAFKGADVVVAFSEEDAARVRRIYSKSDARVFFPPLMEESMPADDACVAEIYKARQPQMVLFTGALTRIENEQAVLGFLEDSWPEVLSKHPRARFVIAGSGPSIRLREVASKHTNVEITGFVESLDSYYTSATVFIVPLRRGAGVKFKTITAMLWGIPIVSTSVGAEGVAGDSPFVRVTDETAEFNAAILAVLHDPSAFEQLAIDSARSAREIYSYSFLRDALASVYLADLVSGGSGANSSEAGGRC